MKATSEIYQRHIWQCIQSSSYEKLQKIATEIAEISGIPYNIDELEPVIMKKIFEHNGYNIATYLEAWVSIAGREPSYTRYADDIQRWYAHAVTALKSDTSEWYDKRAYVNEMCIIEEKTGVRANCSANDAQEIYRKCLQSGNIDEIDGVEKALHHPPDYVGALAETAVECLMKVVHEYRYAQYCSRFSMELNGKKPEIKGRLEEQYVAWAKDREWNKIKQASANTKIIPDWVG